MNTSDTVNVILRTANTTHTAPFSTSHIASAASHGGPSTCAPEAKTRVRMRTDTSKERSKHESGYVISNQTQVEVFTKKENKARMMEGRTQSRACGRWARLHIITGSI